MLPREKNQRKFHESREECSRLGGGALVSDASVRAGKVTHMYFPRGKKIAVAEFKGDTANEEAGWPESVENVRMFPFAGSYGCTYQC